MRKIESVYISNGLDNFKLKTLEDVKTIHNIDIANIKGYADLTEEHKEITSNFIINFMNGLGLDSRTEFKPTWIGYVEEVDYMQETTIYSILSKQDETYNEVVATVIKQVKSNGKKLQHTKYLTKGIKDLKELTPSEPQYYLRIEYKHYGGKEWLHIINNGKEWY